MREDRTSLLIDDCTGVILAGGYSTRFGSSKADVIWRDSSLFDHAAARLRSVCPRVIAAVRPDQTTADWVIDAIAHDDPLLPPGPLRGLVAGLLACKTPFAAVACCDSPVVSPDLYRAMRARIRPGDRAVVPMWENHLQPLVALYRADAAADFVQMLRAGEQSPTDALSLLPFQTIPTDVCRRIDPQGLGFQRVNTPNDLAKLTLRVAQGDPTGH